MSKLQLAKLLGTRYPLEAIATIFLLNLEQVRLDLLYDYITMEPIRALTDTTYSVPTVHRNTTDITPTGTSHSYTSF